MSEPWRDDELSLGDAALLRALRDAPHVDEADVDAYVRAGYRVHGRAGLGELTAAELGVLGCASHGLTPTMTGDVLGKTQHTVSIQLRSAKLKLGAKTTTQACCEALRRGLIP